MLRGLFLAWVGLCTLPSVGGPQRVQGLLDFLLQARKRARMHARTQGSLAQWLRLAMERTSTPFSVYYHGYFLTHWSHLISKL